MKEAQPTAAFGISKRLFSPASAFFPYLSLTVGILAVSLATFFVRWGKAPGPVSSTYRMGLAMLIQLPYLLIITRKSSIPVRKTRPGYALLAGLSMGLCLILWSTAVLKTRVANASLLSNSAPIFVALYAWVIQRVRLSRLYWSGLLLAMAGTVVVVGMDMLLAPALNRGDLLALGSALFYAAYYVLVEFSRRKMDTLSTIWWIDLSSTVVLGIYCLCAGLPLAGYPASTYFTFFLNALIPQVVGYFAMTYALGKLPAWIVSPMMILQPVLTAVLAIPITKEALSWSQVVGGLAVVGGIYLIHRAKSVQNGSMS